MLLGRDTCKDCADEWLGVHEGPRHLAMMEDEDADLAPLVPQLDTKGVALQTSTPRNTYSKGAALLGMLEAYWEALLPNSFQVCGGSNLIQIGMLACEFFSHIYVLYFIPLTKAACVASSQPHADFKIGSPHMNSGCCPATGHVSGPPDHGENEEGKSQRNILDFHKENPN